MRISCLCIVLRLCLIVAGLGYVGAAAALTPYISGNKLHCAALRSCVQQISKNLESARFRVLATYSPAGLPNTAIMVVTDPALLNAVRNLGGSAIVGAGMRISVNANGRVSYANPEYWSRAYFQKNFETASAAVEQVSKRLSACLGNQGGFGGEVAAVDLSNYRYMLGMEGFASQKTTLAQYANFDLAVKTVRGNLARRVAHTRDVYEIVLRDKKIAVFGVAMDDPKQGDASWLKKLGVENSAALPWEIYVVDGKVSALYARYRTALAWPALDMATFMRISDHPEQVREQLTAVAGGKYAVSKAY